MVNRNLKRQTSIQDMFFLIEKIDLQLQFICNQIIKQLLQIIKE